LIASSKLTALGEMAGAIAHEINNPVTIIQGFSNQIRTEIKKEQPDYNKISQNIEKIGSACVRITKIITSLRTVSRDGSHEKMEPLPLKALLEETLPLCSEKFKNHGITLEINDFPENLEVQCQRISISQVLLNLLNNSHDAIENCEAKWIRISARELNDSVEISVTDSGKEIPKSIKEKLMTPFFTTKPIGKGTGLGLSIAKGIVEQHKGTFYLDNNSPNTRFVFTLPKAQSKSHEPSQAA
ncbi:MAG: sensor histidine kinase, partial [Deltaproteobacteria bacterium]